MNHDNVKPGRQVVTFLLICNLTMWVIFTFEVQKVQDSPVQVSRSQTLSPVGKTLSPVCQTLSPVSITNKSPFLVAILRVLRLDGDPKSGVAHVHLFPIPLDRHPGGNLEEQL